MHAVSIVMQGRQMVPVLNSLGIHAAVYGNHDFGESASRTIKIIVIMMLLIM